MIVFSESKAVTRPRIASLPAEASLTSGAVLTTAPILIEFIG
jgi:hypothetical protein